MKRYCSLFAAALLLAACLPLPAQGVQLDSLWGKIVGDVNAMTFSPDSKQLLIAGGDSWLRFFTADKGELLDSIAPQYGCRQLLYSHNGQLLFVAGVKGIHIFRAEDKSSVALIPLNLSEPSWFLSMDISPDDNYLAVKVMMPPEDVTLNDGYQRMMVYSYPEKQLLWQKDVPLWKASLKMALPKGKIAFSSDGNYLLGHYNYNLARWDWRDSTKKEEILVSGLPKEDLIAFSPDRNYFVLMGNYIYNIPQKQLLTIEGLASDNKDYGLGCSFTQGGFYTFTTKNYKPYIVNLEARKVILQPNMTDIYSNLIVSQDSSLLASPFGVGIVRVHHILWHTTPVQEEVKNSFKIDVSPSPSNEQTKVSIYTSEFIPSCSLQLTNLKGAVLQEVYEGPLSKGRNTFVLNNQTLPSGNYFLHLRYGSSFLTHPFIITR